MVKQVLFFDNDNKAYEGGILLEDGRIICGCCGGIIEADDENFKIIKIFDNWVNISEEIYGDLDSCCD